MVETQCAVSPAVFAPAPSRHLRKPPRHVERYWLCDRCAAAWTLMQDRAGRMALAPLSHVPLATTVPSQVFREIL